MKTVLDLAVRDLLEIKRRTGATVSFTSSLASGDVQISVRRGEHEGVMVFSAKNLENPVGDIVAMIEESWEMTLQFC